MIRAPADHDMRHYVTDRTSGLPRDYFDAPKRWSVDAIVCAAVLALGAVAVVMWWLGWLQ